MGRGRAQESSDAVREIVRRSVKVRHQENILTSPSNSYENALFGTAWVVAVPLLVFLTCQTVLAYRHLPAKESPLLPLHISVDRHLSAVTESHTGGIEALEVDVKGDSRGGDDEKGF